MNKFKKILLGVASVLTLGALFTITGVRVDAAICTSGGVSTYCTYTVTETKAKWDFSSYAGTATSVSAANVTDANFFGLKTNDTAIAMKTDPAIQQADGQVIKLPVPSNGAGTINIYNTSNNKSRYWSWGESSTLYQTSKNAVLSGSFTNDDITTAGDDSYLCLTQNGGGAVNVQYFEIVLTSGKFFSSADYCQLTIHSNGELLSESSVLKGSSVEALDDTFAYTFGGYYLDENYENEFDYGNDTIDSDTELFIKWTPKNDTYFTNDYKLSSSVISPIVSQIGTASDTTESINVNNIFTVMSGVRGYSTNGIATRGNFTTSSRCVKIDLNGQTNGVIVAKMTVGGNSARSAKMIEASGAEVACTSGNNSWTDAESNDYEIRTIEYSVTGDNTYYLGGNNSMRIFDVEFIPESVNALAQKAVVDEYTYVRFVSIIKGVDEIDASDVTFSVTMEYADTSKDDKTVNYTPYVVKKITQSGETYTATVGGNTHSFDNSVNPTEYYVVFVLRLTTSKFSGNSVYATTTFGGNPYDSKPITI